MPDNLIEHVHAIEQQADAAIKQAHDDVAALERESDARLKEFQAEMDQKFQQESHKLTARIESERRAEEERCRRSSQEALTRIRGIRIEDAGALVGKVVERICGS